MPGSMNNNMIALLNADAGVFRFCRLWKIVRTDNEEFFFTENNVVTPFSPDTSAPDNYLPAGGVETSAVQLREGYDTSNTELRGVVTSDQITEDDLRGGKFRDAIVTEYLIDWASPAAGAYEQRTFLILSTTFSTEHWDCEMVEKVKFLEKPHGRVYSRNCQWTFCGTECGVDEATHTISRTVASSASRKVFTISGGVLGSNEYRYGKCTFKASSLKLENLAMEILTHNATEITLALPAPFDIPNSCTVDLLKGCAKNKTSCKTTFNNYLNFGGFPFIPGDDAIRVNPDQPS